MEKSSKNQSNCSHAFFTLSWSGASRSVKSARVNDCALCQGLQRYTYTLNNMTLALFIVYPDSASECVCVGAKNGNGDSGLGMRGKVSLNTRLSVTQFDVRNNASFVIGHCSTFRAESWPSRIEHTIYFT